MRCMYLVDSKPSICSSFSGTWKRKKLYQSGQAGLCSHSSQDLSVRNNRSLFFSQGPRLLPSWLFHSPGSILLCFQLMGGEKQLQRRITLLTSFILEQPHLTYTHLPLSRTWSFGHIQLQEQMCGFLARDHSLDHISKIFKSSTTHCNFIRNYIMIYNIIII